MCNCEYIKPFQRIVMFNILIFRIYNEMPQSDLIDPNPTHCKEDQWKPTGLHHCHTQINGHQYGGCYRSVFH
ncbi:hypothetical protein BLOT_013317 [Blomia tropicalis]|nr:hypothetical protein BLOT_013317 [Blomia tropicalis]